MTCMLCGAPEGEQHSALCPAGIFQAPRDYSKPLPPPRPEEIRGDGTIVWATFNPWPQCTTQAGCDKEQACLHACSPVQGAVLLDGRCAYDHFKPCRDIG